MEKNNDGDALSISSGLLEVEDDMINVDIDVDTDADKENDRSFSDLHSPTLPRKISVKRKPKSSWVWEHFKAQQTDKKNAFCLLCSKNVCYGLSRSTGILERHIRRNHAKVYSEVMAKQAQEKLSMLSNDDGTADLAHSSIPGFVVTCPTF